jgi:replication factor A1
MNATIATKKLKTVSSIPMIFIKIVYLYIANDFMKIKELKPGMRNVSLTAKIEELSKPREVMTKFGTSLLLTTAKLVDDTGSIQLTLWGEQQPDLEENASVSITGGFVKEFREQLQISLGKTGKIQVT